MKFEQVLMRRQVIKEKISEFMKNIGKDKFYITSYNGIFKLTGNKEDRDLIDKM